MAAHNYLAESAELGRSPSASRDDGDEVTHGDGGNQGTLHVLADYQPIAAQVYERIQGLRREAYDSSDYLEGLNAFAEKPPNFRGT